MRDGRRSFKPYSSCPVCLSKSANFTREARRNRKLLARKGAVIEPLFLQTGSSADGLSLPYQMTQKNPDVDILFLLGSDYEVSLEKVGPLCFTKEDCPTGYGRVHAKNGEFPRDVTTWLPHGAEHPFVKPDKVREISQEVRCHERCEFEFKEYHGPALLLEADNLPYDVDVTHGFKCDGTFPEMQAFARRPRSRDWQDRIQLDDILKLPGILVPTGPSGSHVDHSLFRMSFCQQEAILISSLMDWMKHAARTFKYLIKSLKPNANYLESPLDSYHCKTVLMWALEKMGDSLWENERRLDFIALLFDTMIEFLVNRAIPNYWIPEQNLINEWSDGNITEYLGLVRRAKSHFQCVIKSQNTDADCQDSLVDYCQDSLVNCWQGSLVDIYYADHSMKKSCPPGCCGSLIFPEQVVENAFKLLAGWGLKKAYSTTPNSSTGLRITQVGGSPTPGLEKVSSMQMTIAATKCSFDAGLHDTQACRTTYSNSFQQRIPSFSEASGNHMSECTR